MYYVCVENNTVISVVNYEPNVPSSVSVTAITDDQHNQILSETHKFDVATKTVVTNQDYNPGAKDQEKQNSVEREFLRSTDWKVLRHFRQKALSQPTSLTEAEYLELEQQRAAAASRIL